MADREQLRRKARSIGSSVAGTLKSAGSKAKKAGRHVAKTTKRGAKELSSDVGSALGSGSVDVIYSDAESQYVVRGPDNEKIGAFDDKADAQAAARRYKESIQSGNRAAARARSSQSSENRTATGPIERVTSRTTGGGRTLVLKRRKSDRFGGAPYEYFITEQGSDRRITGYERTKKAGMAELRGRVENGEPGNNATGQNKQSTGGRVTTGRIERVASRTTKNGQTLVLKRRKSDRFEGAPYEYFVTEAGSQKRTDRFERTKKEGMRQLHEAVKDYEALDDREGSNGGLGGLFGGSSDGGGPQLPDFGMGGGGEPQVPDLGPGDDDGNGPQVPDFGPAADDEQGAPHVPGFGPREDGDGPSVPDFGMGGGGEPQVPDMGPDPDEDEDQFPWGF